MEDQAGYLSSLIAKLYENTTSSLPLVGTESGESDVFIKQEEDDSCPESKKRKFVDDEEEFFKNSSAALIAESTERTLKQMNIDPNSKEGKIQRRKIRNRMSAQIHRDRKKAYIDYLEDKVRKRDEVISILQGMLKKSHSENEQLRSTISEMQVASDNKQRNFNHMCENSENNSVNHIDERPPYPITSPADSSTSMESVDNRPGGSTTTSQSSLSPDMDPLYFSEFDFDGGDIDTIDTKFFNVDGDENWLGQEYHDLALDLENDDLKQSLEGSVSGGGSFSVFSLVLMMSFSFFSGLMSTGNLTDLGSLSPVALFDSQTTISSPLVHPMHSTTLSVNDMPNGAEISYNLLPSSEQKEYIPDTGDSSSNVPSSGGRVLLSLPSSDDMSPQQQKQYLPSQDTHSPSLEAGANFVVSSHDVPFHSRSSASLSSLWRGQNYNLIGTIYPPPGNSSSPHNSNHSSTVRKNRKFLRFRDGKGGSDASTISPGSNYPATDKHVTVYRNDVHETVDDSNGRPQDSSTLTSKILLSEGRVLLNPLLANIRSLNKDSASNRSPDLENSRAIIPSSPKSFGTFSSSGEKKYVESGSNLLTMLVPASSIQWGFEWMDESSPDNSDVVMKHLLKNFNLTSYDIDQDDLSSDGIDLSKLWLEIGCNVLDAKIVQSTS